MSFFDFVWTWQRHRVTMIVFAPLWIPVFVLAYIWREVTHIVSDLNI